MVTLLNTVRQADKRPRHPEKARLPDTPVMRKPDWIRVRAPGTNAFGATQETLRRHGLHTVCEEAACPNIGECWSKRHATVMIMGDVCTRACAFCNVATGKPAHLDPTEPARTADAIAELDLAHVVVTSVDRDDLADGGASHFAQTITAIRHAAPKTTVEVLTPDFMRKPGALEIVLEARPDVFNHNVETVPSLYRRIRPGADFLHSVSLLRQAKRFDPSIFTKSGIMVGLGETDDEVEGVMEVLRDRCRFRPSASICNRPANMRPSTASSHRSASPTIGACGGQGLSPCRRHTANPLVLPCHGGLRAPEGRAARKPPRLGATFRYADFRDPAHCRPFGRRHVHARRQCRGVPEIPTALRSAQDRRPRYDRWQGGSDRQNGGWVQAHPGELYEPRDARSGSPLHPRRICRWALRAFGEPLVLRTARRGVFGDRLLHRLPVPLAYVRTPGRRPVRQGSPQIHRCIRDARR